jgi:hypothetical protein
LESFPFSGGPANDYIPSFIHFAFDLDFLQKPSPLYFVLSQCDYHWYLLPPIDLIGYPALSWLPADQQTECAYPQNRLSTTGRFTA